MVHSGRLEAWPDAARDHDGARLGDQCSIRGVGDPARPFSRARDAARIATRAEECGRMKQGIEIVLLGVGATLAIDLWALLLRRGFGIRSLDYCLLGRW